MFRHILEPARRTGVHFPMLMAGLLAFAFPVPSLDAAATWTVTHLTGDSDSGVSSELVYTCAVNVHGTEDKVVNGVTFKAESGTSGQGWEISQNFQSLHNGQTSTVGGKIGEVLSNRMRYNGDPQKLKMTGLTPGETYIFTLYNQAWSVGETRTAILSLDATDETVTVNQGEYASMSQDGVLVQCEYVADDTDVEFTIDPQTNATWHLYGFSNAVSPRLLPFLHLDNTNPAEQLATLEWKADTTDFTVDDILVVNASISDFQVISPRKQTFKLTPASGNTIISVSIDAARLKVGGEDNDAYTRSIRHYVPTFDNTATPLSFFTDNVGKTPVVWFDAGDAETITGSAPVTRWQDKSGNERHAESGGGAPSLNPTSGPGGGPVIEIRRAGGNDYLSIGGPAFFAKEHFYVFRSSDSANKFDFYGGVLGHQSGRGSNYLFENGKTHFHGNQHPTGVQQNGGVYVTSGGRNLMNVNEFMILRVVVNDGSTGFKSNYRIGTIDNLCASLDVAEIVAFDNVLPDLGRQKVEGYLARKWGLLEKIDPDHPFRSEPPVVTLNGESYMRVPIGTAYTEPGATATDPEDGDLDTVEITYEGPWTPPPALAADTHGGLQLWLKADAGAEEATWADQSDNGRDATAHGSPTLVVNGLNGLPVMRYSGADGEYHSFPEMKDIRTIFWVVKRNSGKYCFLLGDNNAYHFHARLTTNNTRFWHGGHTHANIRNGVLAVNGNTVNGLNSNIPTEMSVISLRTTGNVEASNFSNDRNIVGRYWKGDLAELLIYNTALTDEEIADVEVRLGLKWGLPFKKKEIATRDALDTSILGDWNVVYKATDSIGVTATLERQVRVFDPTAPVITLVGGAAIHHELNTDFEDPGYTLADAGGTALDIADVKVEGHLDSSLTGTYVLSYNYTDAEGRAAETRFRSVEVSDSQPPQITLTGGATIKHPLGQPFVEPGFSATDIVDGDVFVQSSLFETGIRHQGFHVGGGDSHLNFNQNGGLLTRVPLGENVLKTALDFHGDDSFRNAGVGITRPDNYNNLFTGLFVARVGGQYQFQIAQKDDRGTFWFDVNGDGVFEENGSAGSEWMNNGYHNGLSSVDLSPGLYRFAIGHTEHGGGSRITARFSTPPGGGPASLVNIDPSQGNQSGLWVMENPFNTGALGTQTITYTATDAAGNIATVTRTVEIIDLSAQPVITLKGRAMMKHEQYTEFVDPGVTLTDAAGTPIDAGGIQVSGHFDVNTAGTYELLYTYFDENQVPAESRTRIVEVSDTVAPTVTIVGDAEIEHVQGQPFTDLGATLGEDPEKDLFVISTAQLPSQGLWLHLDAGNISGLSPGDQILRWTDVSGNGNHLSDVRGDPVLVADSINGRPAVRVDGDDFLAATKDVQRKYSVFTVSRWSGSRKGRLIGSRNVNWLMGYHNGKEDTFHPENGWASTYTTLITTNPHIYSATSTGSNSVRFYGDGADLTTNTKRNGRIGKIQVGGHAGGSEPSSGDVAEILIYNNYVVTEQERLTIEGILAVKYGLLGFPKHDLPDLNKVGEHTIHYLVRDSFGNVGSTTRKVTVKPDTSIPIITLNGESQIRHEATTEFTDPGATVKDGEGNDLDAGGLVVTGTVDPSVLGLHVLTYNYTTADGKPAEELTRNVIVEDTTGPVLTLNGDALVRIQVGADYTDAGATANDSLDGELPLYFEKDIPADGLVLHLDAGSFRDSISHGDTISIPWPDLSGEGNPADNVSGDPKWIEAGLNGRPVVNFDGDDLVWTTKDFEPDLANYTILSVARYTGGDSERVISTRSRNYIFGFHGGSVRRFHSDGWASNQNVGDTLWHLHVGDANDQDRANFWVDGAQFAKNHQGLHNTNYKPDQIQLGGWLANREMSKCEVAELMIYSRVISAEERDKVSNILNSKYGLSDGGGFAYVKVDTSKPATHSIKYSVLDKSGNLSEVVRTIIVSGDENKPFIVMNGDFSKTIEAGSIDNYTDPGAVGKSSDGTTLKDDLTGVGDIELLTPGTYTLSYNFSDAGGNAADTAVRTIRVVDTVGPVVTLTGDEPMKLFVDAPFQDPGATSVDQRDGETPVYSDYLVIPDTLRLEYHTRNRAIELLYLENEGGVLSYTPAVSGYFTDGVHGDGINFLTDQDFKDISGVNRNDGYQLVFSGLFDARREGSYGFATSKQDGNDYCTIWVDKDRDGFLEKQGDLGDEQVVWDNRIGSVYLAKGKYRVVIAYAEWSGNSRFNARFSTPEGAGPFSLTNIHPGAPGQEGLWSTIPRVIDTSVPGEHTITYFADDKVGNRSTLTRNIIVEEDNQKPVIHLLGGGGLDHHVGFPYKDAGVLLDDYQGNPLDETKVKVSGVPDGMSEGTFTILYEYTDPEGHVAEPVTRTINVADIVGPVITINGANPATVQLNETYQDAGAVATDSFDGVVQVVDSLGFSREGLVLHLDAGFFKGKVNDGGAITIDWEDLSGQGNHGDNRKGDPTWIESGLNGHPVINFDGNDLIWTSMNFEPDLTNYTILTVARYTGGDNERVISSRGRNWFFGFHGNSIRRFYSDGWAYNAGGSDTNWHLHVGDVNNNDQANFWLDGKQFAKNSNGLHDINYKPRNITLGGFNDNNELSKCEVAEVILFDRVISNGERSLIVSHLNSKYGINGGGDFLLAPVDTSREGEAIITYTATDAAGNTSTITRTVIVVDQPDLPVITLNGEAELTHPTGQPYEDAGATVADSQGNPLDASKLAVSNSVNTDLPGKYIVSFDYAIEGGDKAVTAVRIVTVVDQTPPVITLVGGETLVHQLGNHFVDPGFSAEDLVDGPLMVESSMLMENRIRVRGYMESSVDALLDLNDNGGLFLSAPVGQNFKYSGSTYIRADAAFRRIIPEITRNDSFQILLDGHFKTGGGRYEFGIEQPDDRAAFWIDLDGDGIFETNGDNGSELMNPGLQHGYTEVDLSSGYHRFAIAFREGGGHSQVEARYRAVQGDGPGSLTTINPGSPDQSGHWVVYNPIDVLAPGEHQITYTATDSVGNEGKIVRTVVVKNNPDAGILTLNGDAVMDVAYNSTFTDPGVTVTDLDGNALSLDKLVVTGEVDTSALGEYVLEYNYHAAEGVPSRTVYRTVVVSETEPPVITLNGDAEMTVFKGSRFIDPGASATDNYDGEFVVVGSSETFPLDGLFAHLDASRILGKVEGDPVTLWYDQSSSRNHADAFKGAPTYTANAINGNPGVYFDGMSLLSIGKSVGVNYTIFTVSRLAGIPHARLLSSRDQNWLLGYHGGFVDCFHPGNGWAAERIVPSTADPHLYSATSGDMSVRFFADGVDKTTNSIRKDNTYSMGYFQMGGWKDLSESSTGFVSEVIIYDRILSTSERMGVEARLNSKYSLNGVTEASTPVDTSTAGEYSVIYQSVDGFGNFATKVRKVTVVEDPNAPSITLNGDALVIHEASQEYMDAGAVLKDSQGNLLDASLLEVVNTVVPSIPGEYSVSYNYQPANGNPAPGATRVVQVVDTLSPEITLSGPSTVKLEVGATFTDPGVSATDQASGVTQAFSSLEYVPGYLLHQGYLENPGSDADLNLDNNGGLLAKQAVGSSHFVNGPGNRGIQFHNDNEFRAAIPEINRGDRYQNLISGALIAPRNGTYELGISRQDDRVAIWLDLDQDGTFESAGDKGNEQIRNAGQQGYVVLELEAGLYRVAFLHREGGGGSFMHIGITLPGGSRMNVQPGHPSQQGLWAGTSMATLDTSQPGIHTITYRSVDAVGNMGTATRTVVVVADATLPFIAINGAHHLEHEAGKSFTDAGAVVTDADGNVLEANLAGQGTVDINTPGEYSLTYDFTDGAGKAAVQVVRKVTVIDNAAPVVVLKPHPTFGGTDIVKLFAGQAWEDPGIEVTDFDSSTWSVSSREYLPNRLEHRGFMLTTNDALIDFKENGGLFSHVPVGQGAFTDGPLGKGFDFANDQDFRRGASGISRNDQYQTLVHGYFKAVVAGDYQFRTDNADDRITLWMDLDQDGIFETTGDKGAERITWHNATATKTLEPGYYRVAIGHTEGGGGARGRVRFQTPEGAGPSAELTVLKPSDPGQYGIWFAEGDGPIDTTHPGNHAITYFASDSSGNVSTVKRTVIVETDPDAPVLTLLGDAEIAHDLGVAFEDPGVTIKDASGTDLPSAGLVLTITRDGAAVENVDGTVTGTYHIRYDFTDSSNRKAIPVNRAVVVADTTPPVITLVGDSSVQMPPGAIYEDPGATAADALDGAVEVTVTSSSPTYGQMPGLLKGGLAGRNNTTENNGSFGIEPLGPSIDKIAWQGNYTFVYSGQIYDADGVMSFREDIDDAAWLKVDGQQVLDDGGWNTVTTKALDLGGGGWFDFELRLYNAGGGAGQVTAPGFGWDAEGGANYIVPANTDSKTADLFRTHGPLEGTVTAKSESVQTLTYTATDAAGNTATLVREIIIRDDPTLPIIKLLGDEQLTHEAGADYVDAGATVEDSRGTALDPSKLTIGGSVDVKKLGQYTLTFDYTNDKGKKATTIKRRVTVVDTTAPVIELAGGTPLQVNVGQPFVDPGAIVTDNLDDGLVAGMQLEGAPAGLVAHWKLDGDAVDATGNGHDGVFQNAPTPVEDRLGGEESALGFDGRSYIEVPFSVELNPIEFSFSLWLKPSELDAEYGSPITSRDDFPPKGYTLYKDPENKWSAWTGQTHGWNPLVGSPAVADTWQHIVVSYGAGKLSLYHNGSLAASQNGGYTPNSARPLRLGAGSTEPGPARYHYKGAIDDVRVYNRAIPAEQVAQLMKPLGIDTSTKSIEPYVLRYTATDSSGNTTTVKRSVIVSNDTVPPVITLEGEPVVTVGVGEVYEDAGAIAIDDADGNLTPFIDDGGSVDAVDTSKPGEYIVTYDVADFSGNNAVPVTRKVIVTGGSPLDQWLIEKLSGLSAAEKALDADPDKDGIPNLLEYALAGNPIKIDLQSVLPSLDDSSGHLVFTFNRVKASVDDTLSYKVQLTTNLGNAAAWSENDLNVKGALQGVDQSSLPDNKPFAGSNYERVQVEVKTAINAETTGRQFLRLVVEKN